MPLSGVNQMMELNMKTGKCHITTQLHLQETMSQLIFFALRKNLSRKRLLNHTPEHGLWKDLLPVGSKGDNIRSSMDRPITILQATSRPLMATKEELNLPKRKKRVTCSLSMMHFLRVR